MGKILPFCLAVFILFSCEGRGNSGSTRQQIPISSGRSLGDGWYSLNYFQGTRMAEWHGSILICRSNEDGFLDIICDDYQSAPGAPIVLPGKGILLASGHSKNLIFIKIDRTVIDVSSMVEGRGGKGKIVYIKKFWSTDLNIEIEYSNGPELLSFALPVAWLCVGSENPRDLKSGSNSATH